MNRPLSMIVCLKFTPEPNRLGNDPRKLPQAAMRISTLDENAIEAAVSLRERCGGSVTGLSVSRAAPPRDLVLRALAGGLDRFVLVIAPDVREDDPHATAEAIAAAMRALASGSESVAFDLMVCGDVSVDAYNGQVGPRLAEIFRLPSLTAVTRMERVSARSGMRDHGQETIVEIEDEIEVDQVLDEATFTVRAPMPAVVSVSLEANQPRLPTVLQILGSGRKTVIELRSDVRSRDTVMGHREVSARVRGHRRVVLQGQNADEMARAVLTVVAPART